MSYEHKTSIFTFGAGQPYEKMYVFIVTDNPNTSARDLMVQYHNVNWSFEYSAEEFLKSEHLANYKCLLYVLQEEWGALHFSRTPPDEMIRKLIYTYKDMEVA